MALYLSRFSPNKTRLVQSVSSKFFILIFSGLSGVRPFICLTVLSLATTATISGFAKRLVSARACMNTFSWPACRWSKVPNNIMIWCSWLSIGLGRVALAPSGLVKVRNE